MFCKACAPSAAILSNPLFSLPPQDMEICADELKNVLNRVVNKREWFTLWGCGGGGGSSRAVCVIILMWLLALLHAPQIRT